MPSAPAGARRTVGRYSRLVSPCALVTCAEVLLPIITDATMSFLLIIRLGISLAF